VAKTTKEVHDKVLVNSLKEIKPYYNRVLCKSLYNNLENETPGGILKASEVFNRDQYLAKNVNRIFEVIKPPEKLDCYDWECDIETKEGDVIWVAFTDSLRCPVVEVDGEIYHFINYYDIKLIQRKVRDFNYEEYGSNGYLIEDDVTYQIIPTNGYVICEVVKEKKKVLSFEREFVNKHYGTVKYLGKPNRGYHRKIDGVWKLFDWDGGRDLKCKDKVFIVIAKYSMDLESDVHARFGGGSKKYFSVQRRFIDAVVEN